MLYWIYASCEGCKEVDHLDEMIPFELHHKNGNSKDDCLENLELLCPNCHSQTDNFTSRNIKPENT